MINVIIIDDHKVLVEGLKTIFEPLSDIQCLATASTGKEGLSLLDMYRIDVILLDINLPDIDGIDLCYELLKRNDKLKVIALSMYSKGAIIQKMLKKGAIGYLLKNASQGEIIEAVRKVYQGQNYLSKEVSESLMNLNLGLKEKQTTFIPNLTRREREILSLIATEYTTQEIADQLFVSLNTIETHRRNLLVKMGVRNSVGLIRTAFQKGLLE